LGPFHKNYRDVYPGEHITLEEQLRCFRGRCGFRMYIPMKPAKYGMKIIMACDSQSYFMLNAIPYLGKNRKSVANVGDFLQHAGDCYAASAAVEEKPLSQYMTEKLVKRYSGSGRNVIVDKCFTSVHLVKSLGVGLRSRRFLGGVGFLTTLGVGVGFFVRLRMSNRIIFKSHF